MPLAASAEPIPRLPCKAGHGIGERQGLTDVTEGFNSLGPHPADTLAIRKQCIAWGSLVSDAAENLREFRSWIIIDVASGALKEPFPFTIAPFFERVCM